MSVAAAPPHAGADIHSDDPLDCSDDMLRVVHCCDRDSHVASRTAGPLTPALSRKRERESAAQPNPLAGEGGAHRAPGEGKSHEPSVR